ncbi:ArnT family glycosyltransferase [Amycolatopsis anabasis]|uniref:ArnT family glycosyltransferase n=1 Tax=Amycolatopsis anabasis TaxID=1840409 RepID=UPI00131C972E|nr:glycosyltransferase family 39 protein [Amycolatopsis anabasis]
MTTATSGAVTSAPATARGAYRWRSWALPAICLAAGALYVWKIGAGQMGNAYYSAAVKSMSHSFTNFLFGSFDAIGFSTVDKPPMALWPQVISVWIFGYHGWALLLPQAIEGVAAVFLLHRTVRRWAGENVALLAALILTITPITVAINRNTNPDTLLVLLLIAGAYAVTRSIQAPTARGRTTWLFWCAFFVGCGFLTKMLQAWIVVPAFALAFLAGTAAPIKRRILDLLGAAVVLCGSSFWWVAVHDLWPGGAPFVSGSKDGSAWDLVFGYNGLGRVFGQGGPTGGARVGPGGPQPGPGGPPAQNPGMPDGMQMTGGGPAMHGQDPGLTRMFDATVGGQISWLLPLSLFVLVVVAVLGIRRIIAKLPGNPAERGGWFLWGGWLLVTAFVFSFAQGIWHAYYTTMLAPAVAALSAAGLALLWRHYRREPVTWVLLPAAIALTAAWAFVLVSRDPSWHGWARWAVLALAVLALAGLAFGRISPARRRTFGRAAFVAGLVSLLFTPGLWSAAAAIDNVSGMPSAGPPANGPQAQSLPGGIVIMTGGPSGTSPEGTEQQRRILDYVERNRGGAEIALAINGAQAAAWYAMRSDAVVLGMGGFMGGDRDPTPDQLERWVRAGKLKYVLGNPAGKGRNMLGGGEAQGQRQAWVERNCSVVDPSEYGGTATGGTDSTPMSGGNTLYRCG